MQKFFIVLAFLVSFLQASQIQWHKNYQEAQESSLKDQKLMMLFITADDCKYCKKLKDETFKNQEIITRITQDYKAVEVDKNTDTYPKRFIAKGVPTLYFLTPDQEVIDYTLGYYNAEEFGYILSSVERRYKKLKDTK